MNIGMIDIRDSSATGLEGSFEGTLVNTYTDVLDDSQHVQMVVDIWLKGNPDRKTRVVVDRIKVVEQSFLHGEFLTLEPRKPLHVYTQWSHRTDAGIWYWAFTRTTPMSSLQGSYLQSDPLTFVAEATVQGFKRVPGIHFGPYEYTAIYRIF